MANQSVTINNLDHHSWSDNESESVRTDGNKCHESRSDSARLHFGIETDDDEDCSGAAATTTPTPSPPTPSPPTPSPPTTTTSSDRLDKEASAATRDTAEAQEPSQQEAQFALCPESPIVIVEPLPDIRSASPRAAVQQDNQGQARTRRLVTLFRFWRSKTEMLMNDNLEEASGARQTRLTVPASNFVTSTCRSYNTDVMMSTPCASALPFTTSAGATNLNEVISERRLWQTLVMPLVLGCIIFLVAVWTRQISLILMNDTIVMIFIMSAVFIIMSGIAFWLSQDQDLAEQPAPPLEIVDDNRLQVVAGAGGYANRFSHINRHHETHCRASLGLPNACCRKCSNGISIIDYQPPDYYSAMRNSYPVNLYQANDNLSANETDNPEKSDSQQQQQQQQRSTNNELHLLILNSPPSYDQLANLK